MKNYKTWISIILFMWVLPAGEIELTNENTRTVYKYRQEAIDFADYMASTHGFDKSYVLNMLNQVKPNKSVISSTTAPAEVVLTWESYRNQMIDETRVAEGKKIYQEYKEELKFLEKKYGVPAEVIIAITGVETSYGKNMGNYRMLDSLTTLSFDYPRRKVFFTKELEHLFLLSRELNKDITQFKGSYAGAFGISQFMPTSYFAYAKSFDGIRKYPDIWENKLDAFASVANYIGFYKWNAEHEILYPAKYTGKKIDEYRELQDLQPDEEYSALKKNGWTTKNKKLILNSSSKFLPIVLETTDTTFELFLGSHNFYAISKYNPRLYYTMSVALLAEELKEND